MLDLNKVTHAELEKIFTDVTGKKALDWVPLKSLTQTLDTIVLLFGSHGFRLGQLTNQGWNVDHAIWWQPSFEAIFTHFAYIRGPDVPSSGKDG